MKRTAVFLLAFIFILTAACSKGSGSTDKENSSKNMISSYSDVRGFKDSSEGNKSIPAEGNYSADDIKTFWFNMDTVFPGNEDLAAKIIENGKNPGLGVRSLHKQGITGKGVKVAIIDQNLAQPYHSEFKDRIMDYNDVGTMQSSNQSSMHGPAVASLLVGQNCGVAPDAELYFAAAPSWTKDSSYYAAALRWIIVANEKLSGSSKIRAVSISAAPSGKGSPFEKNLDMYDEAVADAEAAGILVIDCRVSEDTGFVMPGYYDPEAPDDVTRFKTGFPQQPVEREMKGFIFAPTSGRTTAEQYTANKESYQYTGKGGLSWAIPYITGVLALGWQADPSLTNDEIVHILMESAYTDGDGNKIVNPVEFINTIQAR